MLATTKIFDIKACKLTVEDIKDILASGEEGVCRAILSPESAEYLLRNHNYKNRGLKRHQRVFLQKQIDSGKFVYNGEAIVLGDDCQVMNGQHRLSACAAAKKSIEVLMVFGVPTSAFTTLDQGARRGAGDVLYIEGHKNCNTLAGALRQVDNYYKGALGMSHSKGGEGRGDNSFVLELIEKYPGVQESIGKMKGMHLTPASVAVALHYLFSQVDEDDAEEFCRVVQNGYQLGNKYRPIGQAASILREWLVRSKTGSKKTSPRVIANVWIKAWNAGRDGLVPKLLQWKEGIESPLVIK